MVKQESDYTRTWYVWQPECHLGPFTLLEIQERFAQEEAAKTSPIMVWRQGHSDWVPFSSVQALVPGANVSDVADSSTPVPPPLEIPISNTTSLVTSPQRLKPRWLLRASLLLLLFLLPGPLAIRWWQLYQQELPFLLDERVVVKVLNFDPTHGQLRFATNLTTTDLVRVDIRSFKDEVTSLTPIHFFYEDYLDFSSQYQQTNFTHLTFVQGSRVVPGNYLFALSLGGRVLYREVIPLPAARVEGQTMAEVIAQYQEQVRAQKLEEIDYFAQLLQTVDLLIGQSWELLTAPNRPRVAWSAHGKQIFARYHEAVGAQLYQLLWRSERNLILAESSRKMENIRQIGKQFGEVIARFFEQSREVSTPTAWQHLLQQTRLELDQLQKSLADLLQQNVSDRARFQSPRGN